MRSMIQVNSILGYRKPLTNLLNVFHAAPFFGFDWPFQINMNQLLKPQEACQTSVVSEVGHDNVSALLSFPTFVSEPTSANVDPARANPSCLWSKLKYDVRHSCFCKRLKLLRSTINAYEAFMSLPLFSSPQQQETHL